MIGQDKLLKQIEKQIADNNFLHFCIITGVFGSGRKTLAHEIGKLIGGIVINTGISVSDIRVMIENVYKTVNTTVHIIPDADKMSVQAKNALLKVTEEPPNDAYFIMTLEDINNTLETIKSRATVYKMLNYTSTEIDQYYMEQVKDNPAELQRNIINDLCETPGEVNIMLNIGVVEFYEFVSYVVDNIAETSGSNSFKIAEKLSLKADSEGYDLKMFLKTFMSICIKRMEDDSLKYLNGEAITSKYLRELNITGVNKQMLFDSWLLSIRDNWMK